MPRWRPHTCQAQDGNRSCPPGRGLLRRFLGPLSATSPNTAGYITLIFRMYGIYIVAFSLLAVMIAVTAFRRGEHWPWWSLLIGNTIAYVSVTNE